MKVLIAEDDSILLKTIELKLKKEGYEVITTRDGREAIEKINNSGADLVITDIMMPFASGLEIVARLRTSNQSKRIPIIMLTSLEQEKTVMEAFALGADDYMTKPFSLNELAARVKKLFRPQSPSVSF